MMPSSEFDLEDLTPELSPEARETMLDLILAWAHLDGALSQWLAEKFQVPYDKMAVLLPQMSGDNKIARLNRLYRLEGNAGMVKVTKDLKGNYAKWVKTRNIVAHSNCKGAVASAPDWIVFLTFEAESLGQMVVQRVPLEEMAVSTAWATALAERIGEIIAMGMAEAQAQRGGYSLTILYDW